jgi:hypothetical protein
VRVTALAAAGLALLATTNVIYHVVRKPTEMLVAVAGTLNKTPEATWRDYAPLFHEYATASISAELLAALAQVEGAGNPMAHTYWRWRLSWHPLEIYAPASSAVGMYQMTDPAFADARRYCIRDHVVRADGCWLAGLCTRIVPSHAIELASIYLDRAIDAVLAGSAASSRQREELAAIVHLCGAGHAQAFARRGFRPAPGERCGDHDVAAYLARINAMKRRFVALAARETAQND